MAYDVDDYFNNPLEDLDGCDTLIQDYVTQLIAQIPSRGDAARCDIVNYCYNSFNFEAPLHGRLTYSQREQVNEFVENYPIQLT